MADLEPIVLVKAGDPSGKPQLYACPKCGQCVSPKIFACKDDLAHETAKRMALDCYNCKTHNICTGCGKECEKLYTACPDCRRKNKLAKVERVAPEQIEECYAFDGDQFYYSPEEAAEDGCTLIHPAELRTYEIDADRLIETILDDHHDDADRSELVGLDDLLAAVDRFNKAQTGGTFDPISGKVADLSALHPQERADG